MSLFLNPGNYFLFCFVKDGSIDQTYSGRSLIYCCCIFLPIETRHIFALTNQVKHSKQKKSILEKYRLAEF